MNPTAVRMTVAQTRILGNVESVEFGCVPMWKRGLDLLCLLLLLPGYLPLMGIIAALIKIVSPGPVFFKQVRVGYRGQRFLCYKFRSMKKNTPNVATHLLQNPSQYVLKIGGLLRKLSLDELPNLINIIKGEMVFVGPRPALYNQDDLMQLRVQAGVDRLKPGLTGWAQVNGRDEIEIEAKVAFEKEYLERQSFWFDLEIIALTFTKVLKSQGVKH